MPQARPAERSGLSSSERACKLASTDLSFPLLAVGTEEGVPVDSPAVKKFVMSELNKEVVDLVWGRPSSGGVSASIFRRWTQGFVFCENEQTALEQFEGGPCAVIAPVQAFLLKNILFNRESPNWRQMTEEEQKTALCSTLSEILESACSSPSTGFCLVTWAKGQSPHTSTHTNTQTQTQTQSQSQTQDMPAPESSQPPQDQQPTALAAEDLGFERFHSVLHKRTVMSVSGLREEVLSLYHTWRGCCGVLLFLYSVILTKGIENIRNEIQDTMEPLIDPVHGHGSQSLVNLLVTGHAVSNVWDGDRECSGMKLHGIHKQASVGFLTLMESLRYCKVGAFLKSPKFPIWILGSETHLSVFFTKEMSLVGPESPSEQARRVFQSFDPEDNGFIPESLLEDVMKALDLVSEPEYVSLVKTKLDPESLGIILLGPFLLEFFPDQDSGIPDSFPIYHYNGLKQSNHNERVEYVEGTALVLGFEDPMVRTDDTPVKRCLQTKWPYIELLWTTDRSPSLN
ncbi:ubiquitin carboxyl-terminal hydrolase MINDY-3 [Epinephelus fuscoguttatus]|uniref:ubiquitin carboxyl-terminal hydrolase MINDY-3 n=1 Tax=Epinephelus fuscoguttatus TaxID=293821 RepID=UPI0020D004CC|nr:ubiquitin carboxyl-terminal hydrolase MINDY-3 [Epinephelus fuscoguttatus]